MKKLERLDEVTAPDGTVLTLYRHDGDYSISAGRGELMSTRRHHSEDKLAELVCLPLRETPGARVLIGGLGLGFTLKAALRSLGSDAQVVVAEIVGRVIAWNENPDYDLAGAALRDPRVDMRHADVGDVLSQSANTFDAIMIDVDNGSDAVTTATNAALYRRAGLHTAAAALRPHGRLAYWSPGDDPQFERTLRGTGLSVETIKVRAHATAGGWHTLFIARAD